MNVRLLALPALVAALATLAPLALAGSAAPSAADRAQQQPPPQPQPPQPDVKFPMSSLEFKRHVSARITKARAHLETYIADNTLPADKADELRARFNAGVAQVDAKVNDVCSDGTVTQQEADDVRHLAKSLLHHVRE